MRSRSVAKELSREHLLWERILNYRSFGSGEKVAAVDQYTQKLINSGYSREQVVNIITNGIKGYEGMRRRRLKEGRKMRSTGAMWFNRRRGGSSSQGGKKDTKQKN